MGKFIYVMSFLASLDSTYKDASDVSRRAILETPIMKLELMDLQNDTEIMMHQYTGLTKEDLVYGAYLFPIMTGKISSKPFKNFKYETKGRWVLRPELEYDFRSENTTTNLIILKEF